MGTIRNKTLAGVLAGMVGLSGAMVTVSAEAETYGYHTGYSGYGLSDEEPSGGEMLADAVIVRPMTFIASAIGTVGWVVSLPFSLIGGNTEEAGKTLVVDPLQYTFARPLGYMEEGTPVRQYERTDYPH